MIHPILSYVILIVINYKMLSALPRNRSVVLPRTMRKESGTWDYQVSIRIVIIQSVEL